MTTSFQAPTGAQGGAAEPTSFSAPGTAADGAGAADDKTVVFEYEGRKYTAADLAKKIGNADGFIETLKAENAETRTLLKQATEALGKTLTAAELLKRVQEGGVAADPAAVAAAAAQAQQGQPAKAPTADEIVALVLQKQQDTANAASADTNFAQVQIELSKLYGSKVDAKVDEICASTGITRQQALSLARTSPKAFLRLFPEASAPAPRTFGTGATVNSQSLRENTAERKSSGYAENVSKGTKTLVGIYTNRLKELGF